MSKIIPRCFVIAAALMQFLGMRVSAQQVSSQVNSGNIYNLSINAVSAFSASASASSSPGVTAVSEANAVLLPGTILGSSVACGTGGACTTQWLQEPDSNSVTVVGSSSSQQILLSPESTFKSLVDTSTSDVKTNQNSGNASSGFSASTTLSVTRQDSTFTNTLINSF